jgi:MFS family permease
MTTLTARLHRESRTWLSNPATIIIVAMMTGMTFSASGAAPTPLYHLYQERFGLTSAMVTVIFAAYVLSLLLALLTTGALSDHIGRRPTVLAALMLNVIAAGSGAALIAARTVQGFATGNRSNSSFGAPRSTPSSGPCATLSIQPLVSSVLRADPDGQRLWPKAGRRVPEDHK